MINNFNFHPLYTSVPTLVLSTALTILVIYLVSDMIKDKDRLVVLKNIILGLAISFTSYHFFLFVVEYIPLSMFSPVPVGSDYSIVARKAVYTTVCVFSVLTAGLSLSGIIKIILSSLGMVLGYPGAFDHVYDYAYSIVTVIASPGHAGPSNYATSKNIRLSRNSSDENLAFEREENK